MSIANSFEEKMNGVAQEIKGEAEKLMGHPIKGEVNKKIGQVKSDDADARMSTTDRDY